MISLHRPDRGNSWTGRMHHEYRDALATFEADLSVRAVVITGTPRAFCVGGDSRALTSFAGEGYSSGTTAEIATPGFGVDPEYDHDMVHHWGMRLPVVAAVNGACAGVGLALAAYADARFGAASAKVTAGTPRLGLPSEYGLSWVLPRLVGLTRATELLMSGRVFTPEESRDWGLWNDVLPDGESALKAAVDYADLLAERTAPGATAATKRQIYHDQLSPRVGESVESSKRLLDAAMRTANFREGMAAFNEKRPPVFEDEALIEPAGA
jgi:enoyl-CoA hydratase/carnithine racemase